MWLDRPDMTLDVYCGRKTTNQQQSTDYIYLHFLYFTQHPDHYSRTKSIAEQKVLSANGAETDNGNTLHTCALRLAAVYGPGEQRHIPRIVVSFHSNSQSVKEGTMCIKL